MNIKFEKTSSENTMVYIDGKFSFHLTRFRRTRTECGGKVAWYEWVGSWNGAPIRGTLTACREKIQSLMPTEANPMTVLGPREKLRLRQLIDFIHDAQYLRVNNDAKRN